MQFRYVPNARLPRLAWCLWMEGGKSQVDVEHGPWVETREEFFCEGAWSDSNFQQGDFAKAQLFIGSGGRITADGLILASSTNTVERLQIVRLGRQLIASNSIVLLLTRISDSPDLNYKTYEWDFASIIHGLKKYTDSVPTRRGNRVQLFYHCNLEIDSSLRLNKVPKTPPPALTSFSKYRDFLFGQVELLASNASALERRVCYTPLATVSTGYDSPTAAVLAAHVGCTEGLTFRSPRPEFGSEDGGKEIGAKIGLRVHEFDRLSYLTWQDYPEAEFLASGYGGDD